ncbi:MAG TPA: zf-HC2 domain-containing protein [Polyangiaceae bacterium]|jgi:anti-sigma factor RsiW|nr:zf-HC2 domain-containing protein [Polyangiaceae bacterium]
MTSSCRQIVPLLEAFGDEELAPDMLLEVEQHLVDCTTCTERVRLNHALHLSVRSAVRNSAPVMPAFEERIAAALRAEAAREEVVDGVVEREAQHHHMLSWRSVVPVAAAAAATLVWAASTSNQQALARDKSPYTQAENADQLLEELVDHHVNAGGPQVTKPELLSQLEPQVGVPLSLPSLRDYGARWEGGSVVPVSNQHAASLRYMMGGHHVTLYVYNSSRVPIETRLKQRVVRNEEVYVGSRRGVSIAATEHRGVGYAIATDLNDDESAELVAAVY